MFERLLHLLCCLDEGVEEIDVGVQVLFVNLQLFEKVSTKTILCNLWEGELLLVQGSCVRLHLVRSSARCRCR